MAGVMSYAKQQAMRIINAERKYDRMLRQLFIRSAE